MHIQINIYEWPLIVFSQKVQLNVETIFWLHLSCINVSF